MNSGPTVECTECVWNRMVEIIEAELDELDKTAASHRAYRRTDLDVFRQGYRRYRGDDLYKVLGRMRRRLASESRRQGPLAWAEAGYMGFAARLRKGRTRRHGAKGWHTDGDVQRLYEEQKGRCFYCGKDLNDQYDLDRKTPLSRGGTDWPENLSCVCSMCNRRKQEKTADEFVAYLANLRRRP